MLDTKPAALRGITLTHITTVPQTLGFFRGQVDFMRARGMVLTAVSSPGAMLDHFAATQGVPVQAVEMPRRITLRQDVVAIWRLYHLLRTIRPHIVHAHTPKAGLLGMIAAWLARVPVRIYHIRGLPLMTAMGGKRHLLSWTERISCRLAHQVLCVSHSIRDVALEEGLCPSAKIKVLLGGSGNGVDALVRFNPERLPRTARDDIRRRYGIPPGAGVIGFVGRIVRDKGIVELVEAWDALSGEYSDLHMLLVGPFEPQDPVPAEVEKRLRNDPRIHLTDNVSEAATYYTAMDLLVLPTYREGFPNVPLEAASMELPVVATAIPGCIDAVQEGVTGLLVPPREGTALAEATRVYLRDRSLMRAHGQAGRQRVLRDFRQEAIWEALADEYCRLLRDRGVTAANAPGDAGSASVLRRANGETVTVGTTDNAATISPSYR
jgi:glycosyltransferase involved in cell wall biosynthesis